MLPKYTHTHTYIYIYIYNYIIFLNGGNIIMYPAHEAYVMRTRDSDLERRSPGGGRVLCREYVPSRHIKSKWSRNLQ